MLGKYFYLSLMVVSFGLGVYAWKIRNTGRSDYLLSDPYKEHKFLDPNKLLEVGGVSINKDELDFEYSMLTMSLKKDAQTLTSTHPVSDDKDGKLSTLRDKVVNSLIERKLLFQLLMQDQDFDRDNPTRYVSCMAEWQDALNLDHKILALLANQKRLKDRICEQSLLEQYLNEKIYAKIKITPEQIEYYYNHHKNEFSRPNSVTIRQIVLPNEQIAKQIAGRVKKQNFATLARNHSITPEAKDGGLLGPFAVGKGMPRFFDVAFSMRPGEISGILKSTYGFHIIMLENVSPAHQMSLTEAKAQIFNQLQNHEREKAYQQWVDLALHSIVVSAPKLRW